MLASSASGGAGAGGGARGAAATAASATSSSSSSNGLRARWPVMMTSTARGLPPRHPLALVSGRSKRPRLAPPPPPPPPPLAAASSSGDTNGQPSQQQQPDPAQAAKEALAAALLGGVGSSAYRKAAAQTAAQTPKQPPRFAYSRAPPAAGAPSSAATAAPPPVPYGLDAAAERAAALNAPAFYTSEQAMSRQQRSALAAERSAALAAEAAAAEAEAPDPPVPGALPGRRRRRRVSAASTKDLTLSPRDWEGDALGDTAAGRTASGNPYDAIPLLIDHTADDLGLEAAARLPVSAPAAAEAQARVARRRERRAVLREAEIEAKAKARAKAAEAALAKATGGGKTGDKAAAADAAAAAPPRRRRGPPLPPSQRAAERVQKFEAQAVERAEAVDAAVRKATAKPGIVTIDGAYDPVDDLWDAKKWHPRRKLWSPMPTSPPRSGDAPITTIHNPRAPKYFRFQPVTSTLSRGWEAVFGPTGKKRDPSERPRPPGAPWKALPAQLASETAPSPLERLSAAVSAFTREGDGGKAIVFSEAMRLDGGAEAVPWLPKKVKIGPAAVAASRARNNNNEAGSPQGAAAGVAAAAAAGVAAAADSSSNGKKAQGQGAGLIAYTPGRLLTMLVAGPGAAFATAFQDPASDPAPRARAALDTGVPDPQASVRSFAYDAGYEYVKYSSLDRWVQVLMATGYLAAAALTLSFVYLHASQGLALALALSWGLGTLSLPKFVFLLVLAAGGKAWLYPTFFALRQVDRLVGWMGERLQQFFRAQALVWALYLVFAPAHWHPLPSPWTPFTGV